MTLYALLIGYLRNSIQGCLSSVCSGYLMEKVETSIPFSWSRLCQIMRWRRKRLFCVRGGTSKVSIGASGTPRLMLLSFQPKQNVNITPRIIETLDRYSPGARSSNARIPS
ncbi:uncharacterized protein N7487_002155 [Penicillium crustosum]|uniref:uncharacterized protein n=1 Tax=Penicillium crustosum TaxID=36656 RepID=UPI0023941BD1|nr:uncharacterized protein N7487_002155 [Penicillium crustosum]KAJ5418605.1 hypothetical protein N7487_002155 [Penicillium crustosum]